MSALLLAIKKIIAILTAIFIPTTAAAPALAPQYSRVVSVSVFDQFKSNDNSAPQVGEDLEPVAEWDVSATENDNVTMSFYDTEDADSVLDQLAGRVTALFAPMTAYAAEGEEGFTVTDENSDKKVEFTPDPDMGGDGEFGQPGDDTTTEPVGPVKGTVVVSGTGDMMEAVYNNFIDVKLYLQTTIDLFAAEGKTVTCNYNGLTDINEIAAIEGIDIIELDANVVWLDQDGNQVYVSSAMTDALNPADMLKYSPVTLIIKDGVTNVSDYAFALCGNITEVVIPEGVTSIGKFAFAYCTALTTVQFPSTLETIEASAFYYTALNNVVIPANVTYIQHEAFRYIAEGATIVMPNEELKNEFERYNSDMNYNVIVADTAETAA